MQLLLVSTVPHYLRLSGYLAPLGLTADVLAAQFEALAVAATVLAAEATLLATLFGFQANFGSDWWSERSNITSFFDGINQIIEVIGSATAVISAGLAWFNKFVPAGLIKVLGAGTWLGALGVTAANAELFRSWSQEAERDKLHAMFGN